MNPFMMNPALLAANPAMGMGMPFPNPMAASAGVMFPGMVGMGMDPMGTGAVGGFNPYMMGFPFMPSSGSAAAFHV